VYRHSQHFSSTL